MHTFLHRGRHLAYRRLGSGSPMVFLHNGGTSHAIWGPVIDALAHRRDCVAVDLLGYGESARPAGGCGVADHAGIVGALIDELELAPATVVGNCMGSAIALELARARPSDVAAVVLMNPLTAATASTGLLGAATRMRTAVTWAGRAMGGAGVPSAVARRAVRWQLSPDTDARAIPVLDDLGRGLSAPGQLASLLAVLEDFDSYVALDQFTPTADFPPICTIWGLDNRVLSPVAGRALNRTLAPAREHWLSGCGHLPMLEQPHRVATVIRSFLAEVQP